MTSQSSRPSCRESPRSWNWVSYKTFSASPFYKRSWKILKQDWLLFVFKIAVDFLGRISTIGLGLFLFTLFLFDFQLFVGPHGGLSEWLDWGDRFVAIVQSPAFVAGTIGLIFFVTVASTALDALVTAGIWGVIDRGLRNEPIEMWSTFWRQAIEWFPDVLSLFLIRFALHIVTLMLGGALVMGFYQASTTGVLATMAGWQLTLLYAGSLTFFFAWSGLTRLAFETVGAPLIIDGVDLGEAILRGAVFMLDNFWSLYRLLLFVLGILLVPLGLYWALLMVNNLTIWWPELAPITGLLRMGGEILLWSSISAITVLFYGALFAFYRCDDEAYESEQNGADGPPSDDLDEADESKAANIFRPGATADDFIPEESPNRFPADELLSDDSCPKQDENFDPESEIASGEEQKNQLSSMENYTSGVSDKNVPDQEESKNNKRSTSSDDSSFGEEDKYEDNRTGKQDGDGVDGSD